MPRDLTPDELAILDVERRTWINRGAKEQEIINLGYAPTRYYQALNRLLEDEAALAHDPVLVNRLRRTRNSRLRSRRDRIRRPA